MSALSHSSILWSQDSTAPVRPAMVRKPASSRPIQRCTTVHNARMLQIAPAQKSTDALSEKVRGMDCTR